MSISRLTVRAPPKGDPAWMNLSLKHAVAPLDADQQGMTVLHVACLHGQLTCVKRLVESGLMDVNSSCAGGRRPVHVVLSTQFTRSSPDSCACLEYLIDHGADVNAATTSGVTPLHLAAAAGLRACTEMLVHARADVHARDKNGNTPLDMARCCGHRVVARYLKDCMWKASKNRELKMLKQVQVLYRDLLLMSKLDAGREKERRAALRGEKMVEGAGSKGLPAPPAGRSPVSRFHSKCLVRDPPDRSAAPRTPPPAWGGDPRRPWNPSTKPSGTPAPPPTYVPKPPQVVLEEDGTGEDLRGSVTLSTGAGGRPQYSTRWESSPRRAPGLPLDTLQRSLFPKAFPGRLASPRDYRPRSVLDLPRRGPGPRRRGPGASPWTEVALHLPEVLDSRRW